VAFNALGMSAANMGVAFGDVNRDGLLDLFVTHLTQEQHTLWSQGPRGFFQDRTAEFRLANPVFRGTGFGTVLADFDSDGFLDLAFVNGGIRRAIDSSPRLPGLLPFWSPYAQRFQIFAGRAQGQFEDVSGMNPAFCAQAAVGRGLASADFDNDGDIDLLAITAGGPGRLFENIDASSGHWLSVRALDGDHGGRDAIGAEIRVHGSGGAWLGLVQPSSSYLSSNDPRVHFGLGNVPLIDSVTVLWPDGTEESFQSIAVDAHVTLRKGAGRPKL
jgi:enediyne biosynthesis protein E4